MPTNETGDTYQVRVINRLTGESRPARQPTRPAIVPYFGDSVVLGASQDVENQATQEAYKDGPWAYPSPVRTLAQAAVAARWALLEAAKEDSANPEYFKGLASAAAYTYYRKGETPTTVLTRVLGRLTNAPYVASKVRKLLSMMAPPTPVAAKPVAGKRRSAPPAVDYAPPADMAPPSIWEQVTTVATNAGLPAWTPTAAGIVAVGLLGFALLPRRAPAA